MSILQFFLGPASAAGVTISLNAESVHVTLVAPTISIGTTVDIAPLTVDAVLVAPALTLDKTLTLDPLAVDAVLVAPTISVGTQVSVDPLTVNASLITPTISVGTTIEIAPLTVDVEIVSPTLVFDTAIEPAALILNATLVAPSISTGAVSLTGLDHSPADILRHLLIDLGHGTLPTDGTSWPIYTSMEPNLPDNCLTTLDQESVLQGRIQYTGEMVEFYGIELRIRATTHSVGYPKANQLKVALDREILRTTVVIDSSTYFVQSVTRRGGVIALGKESPLSKRNLFAINMIASLYQVS